MSESSSRKLYKHESKQEMMGFVNGQLLSAAMRHSNTDVEKLLDNQALEAAAKTIADKALFAEIIRLIDNDDLVSHISTQYKNKGMDALDYIKSAFMEGDPDDNLSAASDAYLELVTTRLTANLQQQEFMHIINQMHMNRLDLKGSHREIPDAMHAAFLTDMIKKIDAEYKADVRHAISRLTSDEKKNLTKVQRILIGIIRSRSAKEESKDSLGGQYSPQLLKAVASDPDAMATIRRLQGGNDDSPDGKCPSCGVKHGGAAEECFALLRSQGKKPKGWDSMSDSQRARIDARANIIKTSGTYANNPAAFKGKGPKVAILKPDSSDKPAVVMQANVTSSKRTYLYIDSQGGVNHKFHFIKDKSLFSFLDTNHTVCKVDGAIVGENAFAVSKGLGMCNINIIGDDGQVTEMCLHNCLWVPDLTDNIFNVWHAAQTYGVKLTIDVDNPHLTFKDGSSLPLLPDYTLCIEPASNYADDVAKLRALSTGVISRPRGATHVDTKPLSGNDQVKFELALQQLNDPAPERARDMCKFMDNVPQVLGRATYNNTATDARMLANAPSVPAPEATTPRATRFGELTQIDGWDAQCKSLLGNRYMLDFFDAYSGDIDLLFAKKKSDFPQLVDRYYLEMLRDAPDAYHQGGTLYSDNEPVLVSRDMRAVASKHKRLPKTSIEYRPTTNAGAETPFRLVPNEMRKLMVRTGMPQDLFEFTAIEAARLLRWCRDRDGKTPGELRTGKRADFREFGDSTFGCKVLARVPVAWRRTKLTARNVSGVNLGKARNQPGYHLWCPEYGIMTSADCTFYQHVFPFKDGSLKFSRAGGSGVSAPDLPTLMGPPPPSPGGNDPPEVPGGEVPGGQTGTDDGAEPEPEEADAALSPLSIASGEGLGPPEPAETPVATPPRSTRQNLDLTAQSATAFNSGPLRNPATGRAILISDVVKLMKTKVDQTDPAFIPPPWFDLDDVKDPEIRDMWTLPDGLEIDGLLNKHKCAEEVLLDSLTPKQAKTIINCLTPRVVKRSGKKKSRVVSRGDQMLQGIHYQRSHSPTIMHVSLRFLIALAASLGLKIIGGDFSMAYINADLPEEEWYHMWPPKSARQYDEYGRRLVWLVKKSLYGGRNSGRNWYKLLRKTLLDMGFSQAYCEPCVFVRLSDKGMLIVGAYVDDLVTLYSDEQEMRDLYTKIKEQFEFTPQEPLVDICGIEIKEDPSYIIMSLTVYIEKMAKLYLSPDEIGAKVRTPADQDLPELVEKALEQLASDVDPVVLTEFRKVVGALLYATITVRPDASYAVGMLSRAMNKPTVALLTAAKRVVQYLYHTRELGLYYSRKGDFKLEGLSDSDWQVRCSTSGYVFFAAQCAVSYLSKKQDTIAMSTYQSELTAASLASLEAVFLAGLTEQVTGRDVTPIDLGVDNKAAVDGSHDFISNSRVRPFERRQLKIRELVERGIVNVKWVATLDNISDIFTKPLGYRLFEKFRKVLMNLPTA